MQKYAHAILRILSCKQTDSLGVQLSLYYMFIQCNNERMCVCCYIRSTFIKYSLDFPSIDLYWGGHESRYFCSETAFKPRTFPSLDTPSQSRVSKVSNVFLFVNSRASNSSNTELQTPLMSLAISSTSFTAVVKFSKPSFVTSTLSSIRTPPTSQYLSSTSASMNLACSGS